MSAPMTKGKKESRTRSAYQAHVSTILPSESATNVCDLTERKLRRIAVNHPDADIRRLVTRMLHDYLNGSIAIAWENGEFPVYCFLKV